MRFGERISEHGFSLVGSVRVSALAEHNQAFVGHQDGYSAREAALRHFSYANNSKKHHVRKYKSIRRLQINQCETLSDLGMLSIR